MQPTHSYDSYDEKFGDCSWSMIITVGHLFQALDGVTFQCARAREL